MPTIKGPIKIRAGKPLPANLIKKIKVPFKADNFKASKLPKGLEIEPATEGKKPVKRKSKKKTRYSFRRTR